MIDRYTLKRFTFNNSWIEFPDNPVSVLARKDFTAGKIKSARLLVIGLGFFEGYINGKKISEDRFLPLNTDFHERILNRKNGVWEEKTGHRIYVSEYDVAGLIREGENSLCFMLGNGWYACEHQEKFGNKRLMFEIIMTNSDGLRSRVASDEDVIYSEGFIKEYDLTEGETHDYSDYDDTWFFSETKLPHWKNAVKCDPIKTEYDLSDCPADRVTEVIYPEVIKDDGVNKIYDIGKNCSGNIVLRLPADKGKRVEVTCSEERLSDNSLDPEKIMDQKAVFICGNKEIIASQVFTWHAARYFQVPSDIEVVRFDKIHTDVRVTSEFHSDNKVLQWIYDAFINTQLSNMHSGIPSDCPHLERRGYTGDGQLTADAVMSTMDVKKFYTKWIRDIYDCQDENTGHVQYTAPYTHSGGGPGGWGGAIVHVPYVFFKHYGLEHITNEYCLRAERYFQFLDAHSENGLVVSDIPDEWCLGDWCTPTEIEIPAPFVNTYFYVKHINELLLAMRWSYSDDALSLALEEKKERLIDAIMKNYYDPETGDFAGNIQGANAFALDIGLGDNRTIDNMCAVYDEDHMYFNTGIFGTDILIRVLFKNKRGELAYKLLTSEGKYSFGNIMNQGATTLWEYWTGRRSHSHPMFGAVTSYLFSYILGISQIEGLFGYEKLIIAPAYIGALGKFSGKMELPYGAVRVSIEYTEKESRFEIHSPVDGFFSYDGVDYSITPGINRFVIEV